MYRIRSAFGIETTFASLEEFTGAVQRGGVSPEDQIYHSRADRWLEVKSHPHYRLAIENAQPKERPASPQAVTPNGRTQVMAKPMLRGEAPPALVEDGFMVMSSGLDSPLRTAGGNRSTTQTPEPRSEPKPQGVVRVMPRVAMPTAPPPVAADPAVKQPAPVSPVVPVEQPGPGPAPAAAVKHPAPVIPAVPVEPPRPEPAPVARVEASESQPAVAPVPMLERQPDPAEVSPERDSAEGWTSSSPEAPGHGSRRPFLVGGAVAAVAALVALLIWRPWNAESTASIAAQTVPDASTPVRDTALQEFAAAVVAAAAAQPPEPVKAPEPQVLAAVHPDLKMDVSVPTAEVDLGSAPSANPTTSLTPSEIARRLATAEALARGDLDRTLGAFSDLLTPARLGTAETVRATRATWVASGDAIRSYRATIARLESAYNDTLLVAQRAQKWPASELRAWSARPSYSEPAETSQIADLMVDQVAEGLDLLIASGGQYQFKNGHIQFAAASDAARYSIIQSWVTNRRQQWNAMPESTRPTTIMLLLKAMGEGLPTP
jgi:hypothetical protein